MKLIFFVTSLAVAYTVTRINETRIGIQIRNKALSTVLNENNYQFTMKLFNKTHERFAEIEFIENEWQTNVNDETNLFIYSKDLKYKNNSENSQFDLQTNTMATDSCRLLNKSTIVTQLPLQTLSFHLLSEKDNVNVTGITESLITKQPGRIDIAYADSTDFRLCFSGCADCYAITRDCAFTQISYSKTNIIELAVNFYTFNLLLSTPTITNMAFSLPVDFVVDRKDYAVCTADNVCSLKTKISSGEYFQFKGKGAYRFNFYLSLCSAEFSIEFNVQSSFTQLQYIVMSISSCVFSIVIFIVYVVFKKRGG